MKHKSSLLLKIILTLGIALVAVLFSWRLTRSNFRKIAAPVDKLAKPYAPLELTSIILKDVVGLDMLQRNFNENARKKDLDTFFIQAKKINSSLDSLNTLIAYNPDHAARIVQMKGLLTRKLALFQEYMQLNSQFRQNNQMKDELEKLTTFIQNESVISQPKQDKILKEVKEIKATTVVSGDTLLEQKRNIWDKVLGRKKDPVKVPPMVTHLIEEELTKVVDTQLLREEHQAMAELGEVISSTEVRRSSQLKKLNSKRAQLDMAGSLLYDQFLTVLGEIEHAARTDNSRNNLQAAEIINNGLVTNQRLMIAFASLSVILTALIFIDISKSNRYRKALIIAKEEADEAGQAKQKFLSNMSHEIRTPLQSIIGYTELVQSAADRQSQRQYLNIVHRSSLHLLHIVNEILDFSKINSDKFTIAAKPFHLNAVLQQVTEIINIQAERKQLHFDSRSVDIDPQQQLVGDPFRLKQILLNLLNNAIKFTDKGSVKLSVTQEEREENIICHFEVSDTGIGISADDQQRIFNEFEQAPTEQLSQGSGLGLSIVKNLVELQGGRISVTSSVEHGSTFSFFIPYQRSGDPLQERTFDQDITEQVPASMVWIIDDDPFILELCTEVFKKHEIAHRAFSSGKAMLGTPIDADLNYVLMDIRMPEYLGMELVKLMKAKIPAHQTVQFIAMTAQVLPQELADLFAAGFDALVRKPFVVEELLKNIGIHHKSATADAIQTSKDTDPIWASFKKETAADILFIGQHLSEEHTQALSETFHKLASRLSQLGHSDEGRRARIMEIQLRKGVYDSAALSDIVGKVQAIIAD